MHDASRCAVCRGLPVNGSLTDDEFFAFLASCRAELDEKQQRLQRHLPTGSQWSYDMENMTLTIGLTHFPMTPIGTFSAQHQTWLWAWANEDFPQRAREAAREIQSLYAATGFRVFIDPGINASTNDAQDFVALAVTSLPRSAFFAVLPLVKAPRSICPFTKPHHDFGASPVIPGRRSRRGLTSRLERDNPGALEKDLPRTAQVG
jgi:hypothetical protein